MSGYDRDRSSTHRQRTSGGEIDSGLAPGRSTLTEDLPRGGGMLQRKGGSAADARPGTSQQTAAEGFTGSAMALPHQAEMERGFGTSFSNVKAYGGGPAAGANEALSSEAYAVGNQIAFKSSSPAKEVVAHELAHTLQQGGSAGGSPQHWSEGSPGDAFEQEADAAAHTWTAGHQCRSVCADDHRRHHQRQSLLSAKRNGVSRSS